LNDVLSNGRGGLSAVAGGAPAQNAYRAPSVSPRPTTGTTTTSDLAALGAPQKGIAQNGQGASPPPPAALRQQDVPVATPTLDRNARYATTYRPGGAALAAFDAAVTKGAIPTTYKDLVGDFGGRYAPSLSVPSGSAMAFQVETDRATLSPSGGLVNLRISMRSSDAMPTRAPLSVHLVLDISGSMQGLAIENAKQAAETLVNKLEPQDDFSMVTFSDEAQVLVADGPAVARKAGIINAIHKIQAEGGTNISDGLDAGYKLAHSPSINPDAVKIVMFLSDGHANAGDTDPTRIAQRSAKAFQDGIQTSSFGLGTDFDAQIMSSVADQGAGGYYYLADSSQIAPALGRELDARLVPVAQAVEVRLRLRPEVTPRKVFGSRVLDKQEAALVRAQEVAVDTQVAKRDNIKRDRQNDAEGGMRFFMPAFARDDRHAMLVTIEVPEGVGDVSIGSVEIKYKDRIAKKNVTQEIAVKTKYAGSDAESAASTNQSVAATVQAFAAGDAILKAADSIDRGNRPFAAQVLAERAELLKRAASMLEEPRLGEEAQRLARLSLAVNGAQKIGDPLPLAVMLRGSGYGYLR
jgi:Ca-activated chloride channel family protein